MKVALIARSTLFKVQGGITVQLVETAKHLRELGVDASVHLTNEKINYDDYDLFHFFDITRPANIRHHLKKINKPFVLTPILIDYSEYDKQHRKGFSGFVFSLFSPDQNEYVKSVSRWALGKDSLPYKKYLLEGQKTSILHILQTASMLLPNSSMENERLKKLYGVDKPFTVVPNGIDERLFTSDHTASKEENLVLCAARIEGLKNQHNLIRALNGTKFRLLIVGEPSQNHQRYYQYCKSIAGSNISFVNKIPQQELTAYYSKAKVHVLPSWFETCGLSSLEAAAMGCNIVITDKGYTRDYFGDDAFYCDPGSTASIYQTIVKASEQPSQKKLQEKVFSQYTWRHSALKTLEAYKNVLRKH